MLDAARATSDFYIDDAPRPTASRTGIPARPVSPRCRGGAIGRPIRSTIDEPVDSSAAAIAAQGLLRLGHVLSARGHESEARRYEQAGLRVAATLFDEGGPYLSGDPVIRDCCCTRSITGPTAGIMCRRAAGFREANRASGGTTTPAKLALYIQRLATDAAVPDVLRSAVGGRASHADQRSRHGTVQAMTTIHSGRRSSPAARAASGSASRGRSRRTGGTSGSAGIRAEPEVAGVLAELRRTGVEVSYCAADISQAARSRPAHRRRARTLRRAQRAGQQRRPRAARAGGSARRVRRELRRADPHQPAGTVFPDPGHRARHAGAPPTRIRPSAASIVFVTSVSAEAASINRGDYCVSKAGLAMAARLFAVRLAEHGIPVFEVRPGIIATDMTAGVRETYDRRIADGLVPDAPLGPAGGCRPHRAGARRAATSPMPPAA